MEFANNMDRDQAPLNVGPDLRSILFDVQHQILLKTGCITWNDLNSENIETYQFYKLSKNFMTAFYQRPMYLG